MTALTPTEVPTKALDHLAYKISEWGVPAEWRPDGRYVGFGDVDVPHGYAYRMEVSGTPGGGYTIEITDQADTVVALGGGLAAGDVAEIAARVAGEHL